MINLRVEICDRAHPALGAALECETVGRAEARDRNTLYQIRVTQPLFKTDTS